MKCRDLLIDIDEICRQRIASALKIDEIFFKTGIELEFYLIDSDFVNKHNISDNSEPIINQDYQKYNINDEKIIKFYTIIKQKAENSGINISKITQEDGKNQFEITIIEDFVPVLIIDGFCKLQKEMKLAAESLGLCCLFQGKPFKKDAGSSVQISVSIYNEKLENCFQYKGEFSNIMNYSINGLMLNLQGLLYLGSGDSQNSYYRFVKPEYGAKYIHYPTNFSWGINNRTCAIRVPFSQNMNMENSRIEVRIGSGNGFFYEFLSGILYSIASGIIMQQMPIKPIYNNAFDNPDIQIIPKTRNEAYKLHLKSKIYEVLNGKISEYLDLLAISY